MHTLNKQIYIYDDKYKLFQGIEDPICFNYLPISYHTIKRYQHIIPKFTKDPKHLIWTPNGLYNFRTIQFIKPDPKYQVIFHDNNLIQEKNKDKCLIGLFTFIANALKSNPREPFFIFNVLFGRNIFRNRISQLYDELIQINFVTKKINQFTRLIISSYYDPNIQIPQLIIKTDNINGYNIDQINVKSVINYILLN